MGLRGPAARPIGDRLNTKIRKDTNGHWYWTGAWNTKDNCGWIWGGPDRPTNIRAHRVAWEQANGEIPAGTKIIRTCGEDRCVNPRHMVAV